MTRQIACVVLLLFGSQALAWNRAGHMVIALIAYDQMDPAARAKAVAYLRKHPRFEDHFYGKMPDNVSTADEAIQDRWVFAHSASWPDQVRSAGSDLVTVDDVKQFNRGSWHYINLPHFLSDEERNELEDGLLVNLSHDVPQGTTGDSKARRAMNIIQALKFATIVTSSESVRESKKGVYLCWLGHLTGDLHQPFHSTALFTTQRFEGGDKGGNEITVRNKKLHATWDDIVLRNDDYNAVRAEVAEVMADPDMVEAGEAACEDMNFATWLEESRQLAVDVGYSAAILDHVRLRESTPTGALGSVDPGDAYYEEAGRVGQRRAVEAGYRLARLVEQVVGD